LDGTNHVNLTVRDLDRSTEWYTRVFGLVVINDVRPAGSGFRFRTLVHPGSLASVVLGQPDEPPTAEFDERSTGLHHLAYHVPNRSDLPEWVVHLDSLGVTHSGITESAHEAGAQIWIRDPDRIWLELYWMNRAFFRERLRQQWRAGRSRVRTRSAGPA
jgi:catechol 2,3-dioxygenase-like lactoylglutathione lyase family enzyme